MNNKLIILVLIAAPLAAQDALSLQDAVGLALNRHPSLEAATEQVHAAEQRIEQAKSGYLPQVNYQESFQRSDNPVYVFGSLLTQHQFTEANFAIDKLNRPDFLNNFQSQLTVDQMIYDFGRVKSMKQAATLGKEMTGEEKRLAEMGVIAGVVRTYYGAVLASESLKVADEAVKSAEADLKRTESVRDAGMATDADVLSVQVHLSAMKEQQIRRSYDLQVSKAALNEALGLPLETPHDLTTPMKPAVVAATGTSGFEQRAADERPELRQLKLSAQLAETQVAGAKAEYLPRIGVRGVFEADRGEPFSKAGANWMFAATLQWNLFDGGAKYAKKREAEYALAGTVARQRQVNQAVKLQIKKAWADTKSAEERIGVAEASVSQAAESLRITRNRYENGLATVTDLLRNDTALLDARTRRLAAIYDQRVAAAMLELAAGTLTGDSDVLK